MALLIRSAELACRTNWGSDLWEPLPGDFSIEMQIWGPFAASATPDDFPVDLIDLLLAGEDSIS